MLDKGLVRQRMMDLAGFLEYECQEITWLDRAMYRKNIGRKGGGKNRDNYSNGKLAALVNSVLKMIVADELFCRSEVDNHKNRQQDYQVFFHLDWENKIYHYAWRWLIENRPYIYCYTNGVFTAPRNTNKVPQNILALPPQ